MSIVLSGPGGTFVFDQAPPVPATGEEFDAYFRPFLHAQEKAFDFCIEVPYEVCQAYKGFVDASRRFAERQEGEPGLYTYAIWRGYRVVEEGYREKAKAEREAIKRLAHGTNYGMGLAGLQTIMEEAPENTTLRGIDRATEIWWRAQPQTANANLDMETLAQGFRNMQAQIQVDEHAILEARNQQGAFTRTWREEMETLARNLRGDLNRQLFRDGQARLRVPGTGDDF